MPRPALATIRDLELLMGVEIAGPDISRAESLLSRSSAIVRAYAGQTWLDDSGALSGVPDDIPGVVAGMTERAITNSDGLTQEVAGPFSRSFGADAAQRLFLTANDKLVIDAAAGRRIGGIGTLSTTRGPLETACYGDELYPEESLETMPWPT
jgi:hypothetical protein